MFLLPVRAYRLGCLVLFTLTTIVVQLFWKYPSTISRQQPFQLSDVSLSEHCMLEQQLACAYGPRPDTSLSCCRFTANKYKVGGFRVPVYLKESNVSGMGVFSKGFLPKGTRVWEVDAMLKLSFGPSLEACWKMATALQLNHGEKMYVLTHGYGQNKITEWRLANDMADYMNHSPEPNLEVGPGTDDDVSFAKRDIQAHEELFENYHHYQPKPKWMSRCFGVGSVKPDAVLCKVLKRLFASGRVASWRAHCNNHVLGNHTFGREYAKYADKVEVKAIVSNMQIAGLKVARTIAMFDQANFSIFTATFMKSNFPSHTVWKAAHMSGMVALGSMVDYSWRDLKRDKFKRLKTLRGFYKKAQRFGTVALHAKMNVHETQYKYIPPRVIVEEYLPMTLHIGMSEYRAWVVHGKVVIVEVMCNRTDFSYVSVDYNFLKITDNYKKLQSCVPPPPKPSNWNELINIFEALGRRLPVIVRIDLYNNDTHTYFSELTLTPDKCKAAAEPLSAEQLLTYGLANRRMVQHLTAPVVECLIGLKGEVGVG